MGHFVVRTSDLACNRCSALMALALGNDSYWLYLVLRVDFGHLRYSRSAQHSYKSIIDDFEAFDSNHRSAICLSARRDLEPILRRFRLQHASARCRASWVTRCTSRLRLVLMRDRMVYTFAIVAKNSLYANIHSNNEWHPTSGKRPSSKNVRPCVATVPGNLNGSKVHFRYIHLAQNANVYRCCKKVCSMHKSIYCWFPRQDRSSTLRFNFEVNLLSCSCGCMNSLDLSDGSSNRNVLVICYISSGSNTSIYVLNNE